MELDPPPRRTRALTEKAAAQYDASTEKFFRRIQSIKKEMDAELHVVGEVAKTGDLDALVEVRNRLENHLQAYEGVSKEYMQWLSRVGTPDSLSQLSSQKLIFTKVVSSTQDVLEEIQLTLLAAPEDFSEQKPVVFLDIGKDATSAKDPSDNLDQCDKKPSHSQEKFTFSDKESIASQSSTRSSASSVLMHSRAKAAAAKVNLQYASMEAELKAAMREAEAAAEAKRVELEVLTKQREAKVTQAEYDAMCEETQGHGFSGSKHTSVIDPIERTEQYVQSLNSGPYEHEPRASVVVSKPDPDQSTMNDLSRFLLKKDLLLSRFIRFNDLPESYPTWKASFTAILKELHATPLEETDLLVKWLGPESSKFAQSIRASNINNPMKGLLRIWERLEERFGCPEMIESSLKSKLNNFPRMAHKDKRKLYELHDVLCEILSIKEDHSYSGLLAYFDTSAGINPVVNKLPPFIQGKWRDRASAYKRNYGVIFPPYVFFVDFISEMAKTLNDPGFNFDHDVHPTPIRQDRHQRQSGQRLNVTKTDVESRQRSLKRVVHDMNHPTSECKAFRSKPIEERRQLLKDNKICFRCCDSKDHQCRNCPRHIRCQDCGSKFHNTALHIPKPDRRGSDEHHGGEESQQTTLKSIDITNKCTEICEGNFPGKSCAKILPLYVTHSGDPSRRIKVYAILDEQSNRSLAKKELFDIFDVKCPQEDYTLVSCSGKSLMSGQLLSGLVCESTDGTTSIQLPTIVECDEIPDNREEIPTPDVLRFHHHLKDLACEFETLDDDTHILLLIGRDMPDAHHILDQRTGPPGAPFAQRLMLGWVVVGEVCLGKQHTSNTINTCKTYILPDGRPTVIKPCPSILDVDSLDDYSERGECLVSLPPVDNLGSNVFVRTANDNKPGRSIEDKLFLNLMDREFVKDKEGNWCAPLPFRPGRRSLPNNYLLALRRAKSLDRSLESDPVKRDHFVAFMAKLMENRHAEVAPPLDEQNECWYLPVFGVYHPKKPSQIRCVFDSSAKYEGTSLNDVLLSGPDLNNSLLGVQMQFRKNPVAVSADIQLMFYCFTVKENHRDYVRFLWHRDNDVSKELVDYRMRVHVFGNSPSPAVAIYGLQKTAELAESVYGTDVKEFVQNQFYVDDGLVSLETPEEAMSLITRGQEALKTIGNLRLHKFASNIEQVMTTLPSEDLASCLKDLDFDASHLPLQRSLGICWDLQRDCFTFRIALEDKPFTRRGILSIVNSIYDPLGFVAPVTIQGKLKLRKVTTGTFDWDAPLPSEFQEEWDRWRQSLIMLRDVSIPRTYVSTSSRDIASRELHVFADASENAIAVVCYMRTVQPDGNSDLGFVIGKAKVAPTHGHTIPRLELCAAVLAVEVSELVVGNLDLPLDVIKFYTDSKVVLGYIGNQSRRFYVYVENRIDRIRKSTVPDQWNYVPTSINPADQATRSLSVDQMRDSCWLLGPKQFLESNAESPGISQMSYGLVEPDSDKEIRPVSSVHVMKTNVSDHSAIGCHRFEHFSSWRTLVRAIAKLQRYLKLRSGQKEAPSVVDSLEHAEKFVIRAVQREIYGREIQCLRQGCNLPKDSSILSLNPVIDDDDILRVGGRRRKSDLAFNIKNPILLPGKSHLSLLLTRHVHESIKHQGRHLTEGALRSSGYWVTGGKRLVSSVIHSCIPCRKLRGKVEIQKMSDLPADRIDPPPPFTNVGVDAFGPWTVVTRRTRGGSASSKRWAIIFTCLSTRAIHIEVVEEMSSSAFINALRRFISIRGKVKISRSDRGTNFVGAMDDLGMNAINVQDSAVKNFMCDSRTQWIFNAPHSSHMGGAWERLIGVTRRILDSMLSEVSGKHLTHDVLVTFMAEICAIVNNRPLIPVSSNPDAPFVLSPAILLTQKVDGAYPSNDSAYMDTKDLYRAEWRRVMALANLFWSRWHKEYLHTLQTRQKWHHDKPNLKEGDIVLLKDKTVARNDWPLGRVVRSITSDDDIVRKADILVIRDGKQTVYTRPISELVLLITAE